MTHKYCRDLPEIVNNESVVEVTLGCTGRRQDSQSYRVTIARGNEGYMSAVDDVDEILGNTYLCSFDEMAESLQRMWRKRRPPRNTEVEARRIVT